LPTLHRDSRLVANIRPEPPGPGVSLLHIGQYAVGEIRVEADTFPDARRIFPADVRTTLHVAGCCSAEWHVLEHQGEALPPARKLDLADA
jgi:hypothetical protein